MIVLTRRLRLPVPRLTRQIWPWTGATAIIERFTQIWNGKHSPEAIAREQIKQQEALESLWENARETSASEYFDQIKSRSTNHWNIMIRGYAKSGNTFLAKRYFDELWIASELYRTVVTEKSYAPLFGAYFKNKDTEAIQALMEHMTLHGISLGPACYASILGNMAKHGDIMAVEALFDRMIQEGIKPTVEHVNSLLGVCAAAGDFARMELYAQELETKWHLKPSSGTQAIRIKAYGSTDLAKAKDIFNALPELERGTCMNTMLGVLAQRQDQAQIDDLLCEIPQPSLVTFNSILKPLSKLGDVSLCMTYFNLMKSIDLPPNVHAYNLALSAYVHQADLGKRVDFDAMNTLFTEMQTVGIKPDLRTAQVLLRGLASAGQQGSIEALLQEMRRSLDIEVDTFDLILLAYANASDGVPDKDKPKLGLNITRTLALMQKEYHLVPTTKTHNIVLLGLGNAGLVEEMMQHLALMQESKVPTTIITHNTVVEALVKADQPERAWDYFQQANALGFLPSDASLRALQRLFKTVVSRQSSDSRKSLTVALEVASFLLKADQHQIARAEVLKMLSLYLRDTPSSSSSSSSPCSSASSAPSSSSSKALHMLAQKVRTNIESRPHGLGKEVLADLRQLVFRSLRILGSAHAKRK